MERSIEVVEAISRLYEVFARYPLPAYTDPCLHCHTLEDEAKLHTKPLRELTCEDIRDYVWDALLVWGDEDDFRHFLPRIFDLFVTVPDPDLQISDPEILFGKFRHGNWRSWPEDEQASVEHFLHAIWRMVRDELPVEGSCIDVECWLCSISQCEDDLAPYLREWVEDERLSSSLTLASFLLTSAIAQSGVARRNAFWEGRDAQYKQLQRWIKTPAVIEKLLRSEAECGDRQLAHEFEVARGVCTSA
jgi:hypothetical protein